jgi:RNA polymerase sigma factor (sigma-70 family)
MQRTTKSSLEEPMATGQISEVIRHLRRTVLLREGAERTDGQLLEGFLNRRDEAALEALICRHGPMVWAVCRRLLDNDHDAEDAFQATFLVLVRRASEVLPREKVANWLYGVAYQTARKARAATARRKGREKQVKDLPEPETPRPPDNHDCHWLLDRELSGLPAKYRTAIVLCDLEGQTRKQAAHQLGIPEGTLSSLLTRGRALLARRLLHRGLAGSFGLALVSSSSSASARVPELVLAATTKAAVLCAAKGTSGGGVISAQVATLVKGMLQTMFLSKVKIALVVGLALLVAGAGICFLAEGTQAVGQTETTPQANPKPLAGQPAQQMPKHTLDLKNVTVDQVNTGARTISIHIGGNTNQFKLVTEKGNEFNFVGEVQLELEGKAKVKGMVVKFSPVRKPTRMVDLPIAKGARIVSGNEPLSLMDLKPGMCANIELAEQDGALVVARISLRK